MSSFIHILFFVTSYMQFVLPQIVNTYVPKNLKWITRNYHCYMKYVLRLYTILIIESRK